MTLRYGAHFLVLLVVLTLILFAAGAARAQYLYLDSNGDGLSYLREHANGNEALPEDFLNAAVLTLDVYFATDRNADGSAAECPSGGTMTMQAYQFILGSAGAGNLVATAWTDNMAFQEGGISAGDGTFATAGQEIWVGRNGAYGTDVPPGLHKLGTLSVTLQGPPALYFKTASGGNFPEAQTAFTSGCVDTNVLRLGTEIPLSSAFGIEIVDPVVPITWGKIKQRYR